jgi:hypothetical protein
MRKSVIKLGVCAVLFFAAGVRAQNTNQTTNASPPQSTAPPAEAIEQSAAGTLPPPGRVPALQPPSPLPPEGARMGGLIGEAAEMNRPLELFNPLAPPEYGNGLRNLSLNPQTGRAEGVTLLSFPFKSKTAAPKASKPEKSKAKSKAKL